MAKIKKAVITAADLHRRSLALQTLIDQDGQTKSVLQILIGEALQSGIEEVGVVICPEDRAAYTAALDHSVKQVTFIDQGAPRGYGDAVLRAQSFVGPDPFLHLIGDHIYVSNNTLPCARQVVAVAEEHHCAVSAVQPTHERMLPFFGTIGGHRVSGHNRLYEIEEVLEKPTPTEAEQSLLVPGLRNGYYLCLFGIHVLTADIMDLLAKDLQDSPSNKEIELSPAMAELARSEKFLACELSGRRYDIGDKYGLVIAQMALAMKGNDREDLLTRIVELLADRELSR